MSELGRRWLPLGLCLLAFALRVAGLGHQSLWRDEVDAVRFSLQPIADLVRLFVSPGQNGPLYYLLLRPWLELTGQGEFSLRFPSAVLGVLAVPLVYRLTRRLFPGWRTVALVAALLMAISPYLVWYSQEGKMYALVVLLTLVSMDRFLSALEHGGWQRWLGYVVVTGVAFYVHLIAVLIIPVQAAAFCLCDRQTRGAGWKPWLASLLVLGIPYLPLLVWQLPMLAEPGQTGFSFVPLHGMLRSLVVNYSLGVAPSFSLWTVGPFVAALLATGAAWTWKGPPRRSLAIVLCWLLLPIAGLFLVSLARPLFTARYLIFVLPAYLVLLAVGVTAVGQRAPWLAGILLGALLVMGVLGLSSQRAPIKADFRGATGHVTRNMESTDLILFQIPYGRYSFEYYMHRQVAQERGADDHAGLRSSGSQPAAGAGLSAEDGSYSVMLPWVAGRLDVAYRWAEGLYTNQGMTPDQVDKRMHELVDGSPVVWLVGTEVPLWDERGLVQAWLDQHGMLADETPFVRVSVRRYRMP